MDVLIQVSAGQTGIFIMIPSTCHLYSEVVYKYYHEIWEEGDSQPNVVIVTSPEFCHYRKSENVLRFQTQSRKSASF